MKNVSATNKLIALLIMAASIPCASLATSQSTIGRIKRLWTYPVAGGGDVVFELDTLAANCKGFWVRPADDDTGRVYQLLLSARSDGASIRVFGDDADLWPGSSDAYCRVTFVGFWERVQ